MVTQLDDVLLGRQVEVILKLSFKFPDCLFKAVASVLFSASMELIIFYLALLGFHWDSVLIIKQAEQWVDIIFDWA